MVDHIDSRIPPAAPDRSTEWHHSPDPGGDECTDSRCPAGFALARSPAAVHSCFRDGVSIVNLNTGAYFRLEALGFQIWKILDRPATIAEIGFRLRADCAIGPDVAAPTIVAFVDSLRQAGLVVTR